MARDGGNAAERLSHDTYAKMALAAGGSRMSGMQVAFVFDIELHRREFCHQPLAQSFFAACASHGGAVPDGTGLVLPLSHSTWGIMKISIARLMPNTLKFTQTLSAKFRAT